jgi:NAD(P)-dependent dehydrogenase (short-subunit alcohol dehydrogenase family)
MASPDNQTFEGKSAFVTGGGTGIGLACAEDIVRRGGRVTIAGRRADVLQLAAKHLGERATWVTCDVTDSASVDAAVATAVERHGPLHHAVNSAFGAILGSVLGTPPDLFSWSVDSTLTGTFRALQAEGRALQEAGGGSIVNISSVSGARSGRWTVAYSAAKAAVDTVTRVAADEWGCHGIRVNSVLPGLIRTSTAAALTDDSALAAAFQRQTPLGRLGEPHDVARFVAVLLSDASEYVTGQCIAVDGGLVLRGIPEPEHGNRLAALLPGCFADAEPW